MMKKNASRMRIVSVYDLDASESMSALRHLRRQALSRIQQSDINKVQIEPDEILRKVYEMVGGRTSFLARVSRANDMLGKLSQCRHVRMSHNQYVQLMGRGGTSHDRYGERLVAVQVSRGTANG
jgi:hypothetical protein